MAKKSNQKIRMETLLTAAYGTDYAEIPVSMRKFLTDTDYLGVSLRGGKALYPIWHRVLSELSNLPEKNLPIFTGAIGTGKTTSAILGIAHVMHTILCIDGYCPVYDCEKKKWVALNQAYKNGLNYTLAVDERGNVGAHKVDEVIFSGKKPVYEVVIKFADLLFNRKDTTNSKGGRYKKIRTTLDHKFWTKDGWKPLKDILVGDEVLIYGDDLHLSRSDVSGIISDATKKVWASRTEEERYRICEKGLLAVQSPEGVVKCNKAKQSTEFHEIMQGIALAYWELFSLDESKEKTKHLRIPEVRVKAVQGLIEHWKNISDEDVARRVLKRLDSMDWEEWCRIMEQKVWSNSERNAKCAAATKKRLKNLSPEERQQLIEQLHTPEAVAKAVIGWKKWRNSLSQEQKNEIVQKQLETKRKCGDFAKRSSWGYGKPFEAEDGHFCDSKFEGRVDDWLTQNGLDHDIHVIVKNNGYIKSVDFLVGGWYIEVDGLDRPDSFFDKKLKGLPYIIVRSDKEIEEKLGFLTKYTNSNFSKTLFGKIESIEYGGKKNTYDVVMAEGSPKNFICQGVVVHNCLRDPWAFFGKTAAGKMAVVFFNLTTSLGASRGFGLLQSYLLQSPWFKERGRVCGSEQNPKIEFPIFEYVSGSPYSKGFGVQGHDIIAALMDEVDSPSESDKQRIRVLQAFEAGYRRFENRFVLRSQMDDRKLTLGKFFLVASKQETLSFLNTFVAKMKSSPNVYIVDIPVWEAKEAAEYCGVKFPVQLGNVYVPSKILGQGEGTAFVPDQEAIVLAAKNGFQILWVPIEYLEAHQRDIVGALRDYAGVSITGLRKSKLFPSEALIVDCYDSTKRDPVSMLTIETGLHDDVDFAGYLDFSAIRIPRRVPRYLHVDIAYSNKSGMGDALGIAMSCVSGWTDRTVEDLEDGGSMRVEKAPVVETDFGMRIIGRPGDKIPLNKVRKFIIDLKKVYNFNIVLVTYDLGQVSEDSKQILQRAGINCPDKGLSLDKNPQIYRSFRDLVHDKRWCCHRNEYLHFELVNLEDDPDKNKIDHPTEVIDMEILENGETRDIPRFGSKDFADAVAGSVENALQASVAPPSAEFIAATKKMVQHLKPVGTIRSLLDINQPVPPKEGVKEDTVSKKTSTQFKNLFNKSQRKG